MLCRSKAGGVLGPRRGSASARPPLPLRAAQRCGSLLQPPDPASRSAGEGGGRKEGAFFNPCRLPSLGKRNSRAGRTGRGLGRRPSLARRTPEDAGSERRDEEEDDDDEVRLKDRRRLGWRDSSSPSKTHPTGISPRLDREIDFKKRDRAVSPSIYLWLVGFLPCQRRRPASDGGFFAAAAAAARLLGAPAGEGQPRRPDPAERRRRRGSARGDPRRGGGRGGGGRVPAPRPQKLPVAQHLRLLLPRVPRQHRLLRLLRDGIKQLHPRRHRRVKKTRPHCVNGFHCFYSDRACDDCDSLHSPLHHACHLMVLTWT